jgi:hypothetical protein
MGGYMAKCPKCGGEIEYLEVYCKGWGTFHFDGEKYEYVGGFTRIESIYICPDCGKILFTDEGEATKFLRGTK